MIMKVALGGPSDAEEARIEGTDLRCDIVYCACQALCSTVDLLR